MEFNLSELRLNYIYQGETLSTLKTKKKLKVLNLFAGLGGNRKLWKNVEVTAIEINRSIAKKYKEYFPGDNIIVADAHEYLLEHFKEFDFIWSSPPCQSHSHLKRLIMQSNRYKRKKYEYFDMKLWQEIILLKHFAPKNLKWIIENVKTYYKPLIPPNAIVGRHYFWSNFYIKSTNFKSQKPIIDRINAKDEVFGFKLKKGEIKGMRRKQALANLVNPKIGKYVLDFALQEEKQMEIFED